ncbi:hypothetical protein [Aureimonas sp. ME7]|uniref:hypothetical protein n=1 Tax=Aureimonas sp. ME7 TaxID=2744252 RepID=UPI0015F87330|nr:hypothetical protein [Aureimonas sp. ME7]
MSAWLQTITGRAFHFDAPVVETAHLVSEVAIVLATVPRFGGHTQQPYSVAMHSVLCAEAALVCFDDRELAAFCLLHDAHETWTGDITRPMQGALIDRMAMGAPVDPTATQMVAAARAAHLKLCLRSLQADIDRQVFAAAGLDPARHAVHAERIKEIDVRALRTERDHLMLPAPMPWDAPIETVEPLPVAEGHAFFDKTVWEAELRFTDALNRFCPAFHHAAD